MAKSFDPIYLSSTDNMLVVLAMIDTTLAIYIYQITILAPRTALRYV